MTNTDSNRIINEIFNDLDVDSIKRMINNNISLADMIYNMHKEKISLFKIFNPTYNIIITKNDIFSYLKINKYSIYNFFISDIKSSFWLESNINRFNQLIA